MKEVNLKEATDLFQKGCPIRITDNKGDCLDWAKYDTSGKYIGGIQTTYVSLDKLLSDCYPSGDYVKFEKTGITAHYIDHKGACVLPPRVEEPQ